MKITEYIFEEYRDLTKRYVNASKQLREMLPRFAALPKTTRVPTQKVVKELLRDLDKTEDEIQGTLAKLRNIRRRLLEIL